MALGWNEVKERAVRFSKEWKNAFNIEADANNFLSHFLMSLVSATTAWRLLSTA